jgi:hypothetical protein
MRTDELIRALAADRVRPARIAPALALALAGGLAVAAAGFALGLGLRPDLAAAAGTLRFVLKPVVMLLLAAGALAAVLRLARPDGAGALPLVLAAALPLALAVLGELWVSPAAEWTARLVGRNALVCLVAIPLMAAAPLLGLLAAMRRAAPTRPAALGAVAGLLAGALAGTLYAMHCPDDSPLFVAAWYGTAIAATAALGGLAGRRWLRW